VILRVCESAVLREFIKVTPRLLYTFVSEYCFNYPDTTYSFGFSRRISEVVAITRHMQFIKYSLQMLTSLLSLDC